MNPSLNKMLEDSAGRYLADEEKRALLEYTESLPMRLQVAANVQKIEDKALRKAVEQIRQKYPEFYKARPESGAERTLRDFSLVVRHTVLAMICADRDLQEDRLLTWLGKMLSGLNFTAQFNRDSYIFVRDQLKAALPADNYALLEPYLNINIESLGSIYEPQAATA